VAKTVYIDVDNIKDRGEAAFIKTLMVAIRVLLREAKLSKVVILPEDFDNTCGFNLLVGPNNVEEGAMQISLENQKEEIVA
jgi:hypothetical protein